MAKKQAMALQRTQAPSSSKGKAKANRRETWCPGNSAWPAPLLTGDAADAGQ